MKKWAYLLTFTGLIVSAILTLLLQSAPENNVAIASEKRAVQIATTSTPASDAFIINSVSGNSVCTHSKTTTVSHFIAASTLFIHAGACATINLLKHHNPNGTPATLLIFPFHHFW